MQDPDSNNGFILPLKRQKDSEESRPELFFLQDQLLSANNLICSHFQSGSKIFWTLLNDPLSFNSQSSPKQNSEPFVTTGMETWQLSFQKHRESFKAKLRLLNSSTKHVQFSGSLKVWNFVSKKLELLHHSKLSFNTNEQGQGWTFEASSKALNEEKNSESKILIVFNLKPVHSPQHSKSATGFVGISDDGFSGLLNCFFQGLFQLLVVKQIVSQAETGSATLRSLKSLFYELQCSNFPVSPTEFVKSLDLQEAASSKGKSFDHITIVQKIMKILTSEDENFSQCFTGSIEKKSDKNLPIIEKFSEIVLKLEDSANLKESLQKIFNKNSTQSLKLLKFPTVLIFLISQDFSHSFESFPDIDFQEFSSASQKYSLASQILELKEKSGSRFVLYTKNPDSCLKFDNETVAPVVPEVLFTLNRGGKVEKLKVSESGIARTFIETNRSVKVLIYVKSEAKSLPFPVSSPKSVQGFPAIVEKESICETSLIGLDMILGWKGPGVLHPQSSPLFQSCSLKLMMPKGFRGKDLRSELSNHILDDYRLWTFSPGCKNWELKELKLNDLVSTDRAVFIEVIMQRQVFTQVLDQWKFIYHLDNSTKSSFENDLTDENLEMLTPSSAKAIVFFKWYDWNQGDPSLTLFKMVTLTSTSNMSQIRQDLVSSWKGSSESNSKMILHLEKCKVNEYKNKENFFHVYTYRADENYELTISKRGNFGVRHVIIDNGDAFIGESPPDSPSSSYVDAKKFISTFFSS